MTTYVTATITAENSFTSTTFLEGNFNFSASGTFANGNIVTVQRSTDGSTWHDVGSFTGIEEAVGFEPEPSMAYRAGVKTGEFGSGSSVVLRFGGGIYPART